MSGWSCRHQSGEECLKVGVPCRPGMRGCVLIGRVVFADDVVPKRRPRAKAGAAAGRQGRRRPATSR
jgi:hypothetical protein